MDTNKSNQYKNVQNLRKNLVATGQFFMDDRFVSIYMHLYKFRYQKQSTLLYKSSAVIIL
jgi:hypothetical protein